MRMRIIMENKKIVTFGPIVVAASCCWVNGAGGGEYFNQGFDILNDWYGVGGGYVPTGGTSCLLLFLLPKSKGCLCARLA